MGYESDINIVIGAQQSGSFQAALEQSSRDLRGFVQQVEKETNEEWGIVRSKMARSLGTGMLEQNRAFVRQGQKMHFNEMFQDSPGIGQGMVENRRMSRAEADLAMEAAKGPKQIWEQWGKVAKGVMAVTVGIDLVRAGSKAWHGDIKGIQAALEGMPSILGQISVAGREIGDAFADWTFNLFRGKGKGFRERSDELIQEGLDYTEELNRNALNELAKGFDKAAWETTASDYQKGEREIRERYGKSMAEIAKVAEGRDNDAVKAARDAAARQFEAETAAHSKKMGEEDEKVRRENLEREEKAREDQFEIIKKSIADQVEYHKQLQQLEDQAEAARLRASGKTVEAERFAIAATYNARIREAEQAGKDELARMLGVLRDLETTEAGKAGVGRSIPNTPFSARFLTQLPGTMLGASADKSERRLNEIKGESKKHNTLLERLIQVTREIPGGTPIPVYVGE